MTGKFLFSAVLFWHLVTVAKGWWCQASHGSCTGQRHKFQKDASLEFQFPFSRKDYGLLRFADWDSDGDMDILVAENESLWFYERLPGLGDFFEKHEVIRFSSFRSSFEVPYSHWFGEKGFEVADWDGDGNPDLLVCHRSFKLTSVQFLNYQMVLASSISIVSEAPMILLTNETTGCHMQAVDFDEDGDVDLALSEPYASSVGWPTHRLRKYFERVSDEVSALEERTGEDNPLEAFTDPVQQIADLDGDGRLDVLVAVEPGAARVTRWRYFRRTAAGTFVEPLENPLAAMVFRNYFIPHWMRALHLYVADWNSDGVPDVLFVDQNPNTGFPSFLRDFNHQHVVDRDLQRNSHFDMYENIRLPYSASFIVEDWNEDGFEDVLVFSFTKYGGSESLTFRRYEFQPRGMKEVDVFSIPFHHYHAGDSRGLDNFALVDWDSDGALDLLFASGADGKVHFYRNLSEEPAEHPFKMIQLKKDSQQAWILALPMVVDWDKDGDLDLFLGPSDGRYFEQLADGSLREWPLEESPLMSAMKLLPPDSSYRRRRGPKWQFVDCDADGDFDLIQSPGINNIDNKAPAQACEHDNGTHELRCDSDFLCLGTNVSRYPEADWSSVFDADPGSFFSVLDGQLKLFVLRDSRIELWTPGFCVPSDRCNNKGHCLPGESRCRCNLGHDKSDCSSCHVQFYSVRREELQVQDCMACPGDVAGGKVCYGRGTCFDDAMAKHLQQDSTAAWMVIGNGSCSCNEAYFYGTDQDGRSTCMDGHCPAGTEEIDGNSAMHAYEAKFPQKAVLLAVHVMQGVSPRLALPEHLKPTGKSAAHAHKGGLQAAVRAKLALPERTKSTSKFATSAPKAKFLQSQEHFRFVAAPYASDARQAHFLLQEVASVAIVLLESFLREKAGTAQNALRERSPRIQVALRAKNAQLERMKFKSNSATGARRAPYQLQDCDLGHVSLPNSAKCRSCNDLLVRAVPDATGQTCEVKTLDIVFGLVCWMTAACFSFLFLTGFFGRLPISDVSSQGDKMVITTSMAHLFLKRADPVVSFAGTGVPDLDSTSTWKVRALSSYQLTLHGEEASMPLETSTGHMRLNFPRPFLSMGIWRCPLLVWCLFFVAATAGVASQLMPSLTVLECGFGLCTGLLAFALRRRQGERTPLAKRRRQFLREWPLAVARCDRGPDRSMTAGQLSDFVQLLGDFLGLVLGFIWSWLLF
ncbi:unnamed protein product [Cladocopium goreaui]|uniref:Extracellular matrix protein FRAS1 n=1 Tax=Cladocopium goreaui TaxID=2562237 RepID=A0A9P1FJ96_9DINO|nr:unnamed protein product [Cladocopium goreaui]